MHAFNWLHLSDLHFGINGQAEHWPNVRTVLLNDLSRIHDRCGPWHAVLFTGDLVQCGKKEEYDRLNDEVFMPIWGKLDSLGSGKAALLAVPGNHDLNRPEIKKPSAALRQLLRRDGFGEIAEEFWTDHSSEYRKLVSTAFSQYEAWFDARPYQQGVKVNKGILPGDFTASIVLPNSDGSPLSIGIVGLNTTFLQLAGGEYFSRLACNVKQIHGACENDLPGWCKAHDACMLMTHQGPDWFDEHSRANVYPELNPAGRFATHLFGHTHETVLRGNSSAGGPMARQWQGTSLFGLEKFGEPPSIDRRHGYGAGRIERSNCQYTIRYWPRKAFKDANGWRFEPDHEGAILVEGDSGTQPEFIVSHAKQGGYQTRPATNKSSGPEKCVASDPDVGALAAVWPMEEGQFKEYCKAVSDAHSHIRFVEVPFLKDVSDVELDRLYVEPRFSRQEIKPDLATHSWPECFAALQLVTNRPHLVLLGDPGSGKSTLISSIAWQLCRTRQANESLWCKNLGGLIPLPIILRELHLRADLTWEGLLDSFLEHPIGKLLRNRKTIETLLSSGRAIILLDGLDEVGNLAIRRKLREAVHTGMTDYRKTRWILTSRSVGYETVPFHVRIDKIPADATPAAEVVDHQKRTKSVRIPMADLLFLAPFNDSQIKQFAANWYAQHEKSSAVIDQATSEFVGAIRENEGTQRLARIPYLLTLMALIHQKNARLPHGRTELYDRIAAAYLESIDLRRRLDQLPYSLAQKKRWLAEVAYRMQLRRSKKSEHSIQGDVLATRPEVERWLRGAMTDSVESESKQEAGLLLDYFARRSGLLLPRAEGKFAFMHLSLQEYFAACFLEPRLTASRFSRDRVQMDPTDEQLKAWANTETWREAFVLLFELLSNKSKTETESFLRHLFDGRLAKDPSGKEANAAGLLAELATDPFVFLTAQTRQRCRQQLWRWCFGLNATERRGFIGRYRNNVIRILLRESQGDISKAWHAASIGKQELRAVRTLDLGGCQSFNDLSPLKALKNLQSLGLSDCRNVKDITPLIGLKNLYFLDLQGCGGVEGEPRILGRLKTLKTLFINEPIDLGILSTLDELSELHLHYSRDEPIDAAGIAGLAKLDHVCCRGLLRLPKELADNPQRISSAGVRSALARATDVERNSPRKRVMMARAVKRK